MQDIHGCSKSVVRATPQCQDLSVAGPPHTLCQHHHLYRDSTVIGPKLSHQLDCVSLPPICRTSTGTGSPLSLDIHPQSTRVDVHPQLSQGPSQLQDLQRPRTSTLSGTRFLQELYWNTKLTVAGLPNLQHLSCHRTSTVPSPSMYQYLLCYRTSPFEGPPISEHLHCVRT